MEGVYFKPERLKPIEESALFSQIVEKFNFDEIYEKYTQKAKEQGFYGELKFIKEHSRVMIYVVVN